MKKLLFFITLFAALSGTAVAQKSIHKFKATDLEGNTVNLKDYSGKVLLIVNVASKCGLTPQYENLEALYQKYKDQGFEILAFPCNQFLQQEPGTNQEIRNFCTSNFSVTFKMMDKIDVNGKKAHPIYKWLKAKAPFQGYPAEGAEFGAMLTQIHQKTNSGFDQGNEVKWNFGKFLVSKDGKTVIRFEPMVDPASLIPYIEKALAE